ncbi:hypothetical protein BKA70DRAFT_1223018 [Coprinopsis sp. MPI-PUGE-AT-0042]|nr:hypothetical protein BKA70DRAFT_1223018 [Coprinopsis sp. MPI-PUGE-AT-0042]
MGEVSHWLSSGTTCIVPSGNLRSESAAVAKRGETCLIYKAQTKAKKADCGQGKLELLSKARESVITKIMDSRNQQQELLKMEHAVIQDANMHKKAGSSGVVAPVLVDWGASPSHDKTLK